MKAKIRRRKLKREHLRGVPDGEWTPWDLWERGVSWSRLSTFLTCRNQAFLSDVEGWYKPGFSLPLEFGNVCHEILERKWRGDRATVSTCVAQHWSACQTAYLNDGATMTDLEWLYGVACVTMEEYFEARGLQLDATDILETEQRIQFVYEYPDGKQTTVNGVIDAVSQRPKQVQKWIWDTKTGGEINVDDYADEVRVNFQLNVYALQKKLDGERVGGIGVNLIRRSGMTPSKKTDETLEAMLVRLRKDIRKRPDYYFMTFRHAVSNKAMDDWQRTQLDPIMADIRLWAEGFGEWYEGYSWFPHTPTYTNPLNLKVQRRKVDLYYALTKGDFTELRKRGK